MDLPGGGRIERNGQGWKGGKDGRFWSKPNRTTSYHLLIRISAFILLYSSFPWFSVESHGYQCFKHKKAM